MPRLIAIAFLLAAAAAHGEPPAATLARAKAWLEPARPSSRVLQIVARKPDGAAERWTAGHARAAIDGANWSLTVLLEPAALRGTALLVREQRGKPDDQWWYAPGEPVQALSPGDPFAALAGSELTRGELGFLDLELGTPTAAGSERVGDAQVAKVEQRLGDGAAAKRVVTWVAAGDGRPLKREWYDASDRLWQVVSYEHVAAIHGVPTAQRVRIENVRSGAGAEYRATRIAYEAPLPRGLFDPAALAGAAEHPIWR